MLLILVGVELPLRVVVTILECCVTFSGVKLSIRSFVLFQRVPCISAHKNVEEIAEKTYFHWFFCFLICSLSF